jgi:polyribonucleotide nucleotidyltransferase
MESNTGFPNVQRAVASLPQGEISFETGKMALQANAAVVGRQGDTVVLATAVLGRIRENIDYFPLLVDYEERLYAAGKIKGSRWVKREGRATDSAILTGRVIDRSLRPLFPDGMRNDVQIVVTVLSYDGEHEADMLAVNAASAALTMSDIPFLGPIASVRIGILDGQFVLNPTKEQQLKSKMNLIVSGNGDHIMMVEAGANLVSEAEIIGGIAFAKPHLATLCAAQLDLRSKAGKEKAEVDYYHINEAVYAWMQSYVTPEKLDAAIYVPSMYLRDDQVAALEKEIFEAAKQKFIVDAGQSSEGAEGAIEKLEEKFLKAEIRNGFDKIKKAYVQKNLMESDRRMDGRAMNETRPIYCEVGVLPRTHGSALFTRGETQVLTTVTLGSKGDEQLLDGMEDPGEGTAKRYIHHYNFPGYSVGEVSPIRGPGRREIGHGALAERALEPVLPDAEDFPYTMRLVSEAISSNGSTSMASTCGSTLALMDAGVNIKEMIGGVAMGLVLDELTGKFKVMTDIAGAEDHNGHMDFKVTGNENGITALQLDVKVKGLTQEILEQALEQAKPGRLHILAKMKEAISAPRADLSKYAPRIVSFKIQIDKIRDVIGSGGKVINGIIAETGVKIDIEDDGLVMVVSSDAAASEKAVGIIKGIVKEVIAGEVYDGKVTRLMTFGAFVEILPNKEGLVHISELANSRIERVEDAVKVGDPLKVMVKEIDDQGRINLTHRPFAKSGNGPKGGDGGPTRDDHHDRGPRLEHRRDDRGPRSNGNGGGHNGPPRSSNGGPRPMRRDNSSPSQGRFNDRTERNPHTEGSGVAPAGNGLNQAADGGMFMKRAEPKSDNLDDFI